ncbi:hypothetical protein VTJ83DRAFT_6624 [Remersonia thermophila]|uniref:Uncharacterized protein n=1 Tax=Remersonia thermophila TaxID=72144 RepID=A0ABR4D597_9PEZI
MATSTSDQDYLAFLTKANEPLTSTSSTSVSAAAEGAVGNKKSFRTTQEGVEVPKLLARVCEKPDAVYVSDADEPFEAVALAWDETGKGLPDEVEFAQLIEHWDPEHAEVEILDPADWDAHGQYNVIVDAVREAGEGNDVRVYRVVRDRVRVEYFVVTTEGKGKGAKLVGVKALAVES